MNFVGEERLTRKKIIFELEDVEKCETRIEYVKARNGENLPMTKWYAILKSGEELLLNISAYNEIMKYKKF